MRYDSSGIRTLSVKSRRVVELANGIVNVPHGECSNVLMSFPAPKCYKNENGKMFIARRFSTGVRTRARFN